jgi:UDPglucose--hexose-1-phosphate uridylyltransferase
MPELRKDPILGRWVIIAVERARRPKGFKPHVSMPEEGACPFCEGRESQTPPEIFSIRKEGSKPNQPGWDTRVVPSKAPFLKVEGDLNRHGRGIYDVMGGVGAHEVLIETPKHIANIADLEDAQIAKVVTCWIDRFIDLSRDERFKYVLVFKNYGWASGGGRVRHSRTQLIATPVTPKRVKEELAGAKKYYDYHERCIFCDLIRQELLSKERVVLEIDGFVAITPFASRFPFEVWILPKQHHCDFSSLSVESRLHLAKTLKKVLSKLKQGLNDPPYNFVLHTSPFRRKKTKSGYWKTIEDDYHWHIEIIPRLTSPAGFEWGTGFYICPIAPEETAKFLREVEGP